MNTIASKIIATRKSRGLSQEELAEQSKISLRTLQRIENNENNPRESTLALLCETLELNLQDLTNEENTNNNYGIGTKIINLFFLIIINLTLVSIIGFLTLDSNANLNSRLAGVLLSILIPFTIVYFTQKITPTERFLKFGFGYLAYLIGAICIAGFISGFLSGLFLCLVLSLLVLYFGDRFIEKNK